MQKANADLGNSVDVLQLRKCLSTILSHLTTELSSLHAINVSRSKINQLIYVTGRADGALHLGSSPY